jgi:Ca2+:H+ antiporter
MISSPSAPEASGLNRIELAILVLSAALTAAVIVMDVVGGGSKVAIFSLSGVTLMFLAWLLGEATDQLGHTVGSRMAGIMNATFGNLPELVIVLLLIDAATPHNGLINVAKASIMGSVLGNMLLVLGASFFIGGLRNGAQQFTTRLAGLHVSMLMLAVVGLAIPTAIHGLNGKGDAHIEGISIATSIVLFIAYIGSLKFFFSSEEHSPEHSEPARWSKRISIPVLAASAIAVAVVSEALVGSIHDTVTNLGISETFMGFILVPIVGNIAEHLVAVQVAWRNNLDFAMTIALGSSVQVALGLAPLAVFASHLLGNPLNLAFGPLQVLCLGLATVAMPAVFTDGETTWIEGLQLMSLYAIVGIAFWY